DPELVEELDQLSVQALVRRFLGISGAVAGRRHDVRTEIAHGDDVPLDGARETSPTCIDGLHGSRGGYIGSEAARCGLQEVERSCPTRATSTTTTIQSRGPG